MANPQWAISGDYFEACSCDSVCPCPTSGLAARPTKGSCDAGLVFHVERGSYGDLHLVVRGESTTPAVREELLAAIHSARFE